jgi:hypothetical protein
VRLWLLFVLLLSAGTAAFGDKDGDDIATNNKKDDKRVLK